MARYEVSSPEPRFTGAVAGVNFVDGKATVDSGQHPRAMAYFGRHGYVAVEVDADGKPVPVEAGEVMGTTQVQNQDATPPGGRRTRKTTAAKKDGAEQPAVPAEDATDDEWRAYVIATATDDAVRKAAETMTRDELVATAKEQAK